jgi:hypothetical protein
MSLVILQPTGNQDARIHYEDTIIKPVRLEEVKKYLTAENYNELSSLYNVEEVSIWGVTRGTNDVNFNKWNKIKPGDISLFARNKKIFSSAVVTYKLHNKSLAKSLWGTNSDGDTWECIYFLDELNSRDISYELFNRVVGYSPKFVIQGFSVLDEEKSEKLITSLGLQSQLFTPPVSRQEYEEVISNKELASLEIEVNRMARAEQGYLRKKLFGNKKVDRCGICGEEFTINFLVAAHIKKRSACSEEEKLDFENIVMPMCKFGCDDLYEKGYIGINNGQISVFKYNDLTPYMKGYVGKLSGNECTYWSKSTQEYFKWHYHLHSVKHDILV